MPVSDDFEEEFDFGRFDLAAQSEAGKDFAVIGPRGKPLTYKGAPVTIKLAGKDSPRFKNRQRELAREKIEEGIERADIEMEMLIVCTLGWSGIRWNGKLLEFSAENARMLYGKDELLRENAAQFILERANFLDYARSD